MNDATDANNVVGGGVEANAPGPVPVYEPRDCPLHLAETFSVAYSGDINMLKITAVRVYADGSAAASCVMALPIVTAKALGFVLAETIRLHEAGRGSVGLSDVMRPQLNAHYIEGVRNIASKPLTY